MEDRREHGSGQGPEARARREQLLRIKRGAANIARERQVGQPVDYRDADQRARRMQVLLSRAHVRTLLNQFRRQAERQIPRQVQPGEIEFLGQITIGKAAGESDQQVALLRQLLLQRRQRLLDLRQRGLLRHHVGFGNLAGGELGPEQTKEIGRELDDGFRRVDLAPQRSFLHGGEDEVRRQGQVGRFQREALVVGLGLQRLDVPPRAAEYVRRVGHQHLAGKQVENGRKPELAGVVDGTADRGLLPRRRKAAVDGRIERTLAGRARSPARRADAAWAAARSGLFLSAFSTRLLSGRELNTRHQSPGISRPLAKRCAFPSVIFEDAVCAGKRPGV